MAGNPNVTHHLVVQADLQEKSVSPLGGDLGGDAVDGMDIDTDGIGKQDERLESKRQEIEEAGAYPNMGGGPPPLPPQSNQLLAPAVTGTITLAMFFVLWKDAHKYSSNNSLLCRDG